MFNSKAFAAESVGSSGISTSLAGFIPLVLIFVVFYFLIIRPQQKKLKEHNKVLDAIKRGDKVVTSGGIMGVVNKVDAANSTFSIEIAPKVEIKVLKSAISEVLSKASSKQAKATKVDQDQSKPNENEPKDKEDSEKSSS